VHFRSFLFAAAVLAVSLSTIQLTGQTMGGAVPPGSYVKSCSQIAYNAQTQILRANCPGPTPSQSTFSKIMGAGPAFVVANPNELNISYCQPGADIENNDGWLQCAAKPGTWGYLGAVPNGSYQMSCNKWLSLKVFINGQTVSRLSATCRTFTDKTSTTVALLILSNCQMGGDIENIHGTLLCAALPPGQQPQPVNNRVAPRTAPAAQGAPGTCKQGFVWRQANPEDHACVLSVSRQQAVNDNASAVQYTVKGGPAPALCLQGYVWREANAQDHVCVSPQVRTQTAQENQQSPARTW
jgi:hypothetical protein